MTDSTPSWSWPNTVNIRLALSQLAEKEPDPVSWERIGGVSARFGEGRELSRTLSVRASELIAGGSQHSLALGSPFPIQFQRAKGPYIWDVDGNRYVDFVQAGGASLLGSAPASIGRHVASAIERFGPSIALGHPEEIELASAIHEQFPSIERFRMLGSGTEAVMAAIRVARAFTGAANVVKHSGAYHGWSDQVVLGLNAPGPGERRIRGVPEATLSFTSEVASNDTSALEQLLEFNETRGGTAAVIVEPLGPQSGGLPVDEPYNAEVARLCRNAGALLIFDEVVTGFRLGTAGVQGHLNMRPDLTVLGKCLTAGYPTAGGLGGRSDVMGVLSPGNPAFTLVAGTLSANPVATAAGCAAISEMRLTDAARVAALNGELLTEGLAGLISEYDLPFVTYGFGSVVHIHTTGVSHLRASHENFIEESFSRWRLMNTFAAAALIEGLVVPVSGRLFVSTTHLPDVISEVLERFERLFARFAGIDF